MAYLTKAEKLIITVGMKMERQVNLVSSRMGWIGKYKFL